MEKKYEFIESDIKGLYRIRASRRINYFVAEGDIGGYVQAESNLSQAGTCWIYGNAKVMENAKILDDAEVLENSTIKGYAKVMENASVYDNAEISGTAVIAGHSDIRGNAKIINATILDSFIEGDVNIHSGACINESSSNLTKMP